MIVVGLVLVMAFAHAAVRLCMYILRPPQYPISRATSNAAVAPEEPIHVILRRDEEEFSDEETDSVPKDAVLPAPPPVYGLWRGSTVSTLSSTPLRSKLTCLSEWTRTLCIGAELRPCNGKELHRKGLLRTPNSLRPRIGHPAMPQKTG